MNDEQSPEVGAKRPVCPQAFSIEPDVDGSASLVDALGRALLEGSRRNGKVQMTFAAGSGIDAGFGLAGRVGKAFELRGAGTLALAGRALANVSVSATPVAMTISIPVPWGASSLDVMLGWRAEERDWLGQRDFQEELLGTVSTTIRLPVKLAVQLGAGPTGSALFNLSIGVAGRLCEVRVDHADLQPGLGDLREWVLRKLRRQLADLAEDMEQELDAALEAEAAGHPTAYARPFPHLGEGEAGGDDGPAADRRKTTNPAPRPLRQRTLATAGAYLGEEPRSGAFSIRPHDGPESPPRRSTARPVRGYLDNGQPGYLAPTYDWAPRATDHSVGLAALPQAPSALAKLSSDSPTLHLAENLLRTKDIMRKLPL